MDRQYVTELSCQIVWEYPNWESDGGETIGAILDTYHETGEPVPCDHDTLYEACLYTKSNKDKGLTYQECYSKEIVDNWKGIV